MSRLVIVIDVLADPVLEDPHEVAASVLEDSDHGYSDLPEFRFIGATWEAPDWKPS